MIYFKQNVYLFLMNGFQDDRLYEPTGVFFFFFLHVDTSVNSCHIWYTHSVSVNDLSWKQSFTYIF